MQRRTAAAEHLLKKAELRVRSAELRAQSAESELLQLRKLHAVSSRAVHAPFCVSYSVFENNHALARCMPSLQPKGTHLPLHDWHDIALHKKQ